MASQAFVFARLLASSTLVSCVLALSGAPSLSKNFAVNCSDPQHHNSKACACVSSNRKKGTQLQPGKHENCSALRVTNFNNTQASNSNNGGDGADGDDGDDDAGDNTGRLGNPGNDKSL